MLKTSNLGIFWAGDIELWGLCVCLVSRSSYLQVIPLFRVLTCSRSVKFIFVILFVYLLDMPIVVLPSSATSLKRKEKMHLMYYFVLLFSFSGGLVSINLCRRG